MLYSDTKYFKRILTFTNYKTLRNIK